MTQEARTIYVVFQDYKGNIRGLKAFWNYTDALKYEQHEWDTDCGLASFDIMEVEIDD